MKSILFFFFFFCSAHSISAQFDSIRIFQQDVNFYINKVFDFNDKIIYPEVSVSGYNTTTINILDKEFVLQKSIDFEFDGFSDMQLSFISKNQNTGNYIIITSGTLEGTNYLMTVSVDNNFNDFVLIDSVNTNGKLGLVINPIKAANGSYVCFGTIYKSPTDSSRDDFTCRIDSTGNIENYHKLNMVGFPSTGFPIQDVLRSSFDDKYYAWKGYYLLEFDSNLNYVTNYDANSFDLVDTILPSMYACDINEIRLNEFICSCRFYESDKVLHSFSTLGITENEYLDRIDHFEFNKRDSILSNYPASEKSLIKDEEGNYYCGGIEDLLVAPGALFKGNPNKIYLYKFNQDLELLWDIKLGGEKGHYLLTSVNNASDGGCIMSGLVYNYFDQELFNGFIVKVDKEGNLVNSIEFPQDDVSMTLFPNPSSNYLNVKMENTDMHELNYALFDISGRKIGSNQLINTSTKYIDVSHLMSGTYFLRFTNDKTLIAIKKFIKI